MAKREWLPGIKSIARGTVDYFAPYRYQDQKQRGSEASLEQQASEQYDTVQQAMRDRAGKGRATGISYTDPVTGKMKEFRVGGYRPASKITINGRTFTGDNVYKARDAVRQSAADYRKRSEFRDAMVSLANPNDPKGQRFIKAVNSWFDSGKEITDRMRVEFGNVLKGRYAKIQETVSKMKPGDYLDFRKEQEKRVGASGPSDSPGPGARSAPQGSSSSRRFAGGPQDTGGGRSVVRPYTGNYSTGIDRSEGRAREQEEHERRQYLWSGRGQRDYWQSKLIDTMQRKEADDARRMHNDLLKLMATSRKYGINLDEAQVDTSRMLNDRDSTPFVQQKTRPVSGDKSSYWTYRDKPDPRSYRMQEMA